MLLPRPIPNPESICLDSMAITNFAATSDPPTPFEIKKRTPGWNDISRWRDIIVIHCVYAHKRMGVRWISEKGKDWDLMEYRIPTRVLYPQSPRLAKIWIEKAEDWVQLQTESAWRPLHLDRWTNSAFSILGPVATYPNFCHFVYDQRRDAGQYASKYSTNDWKSELCKIVSQQAVNVRKFPYKI